MHTRWQVTLKYCQSLIEFYIRKAMQFNDINHDFLLVLISMVRAEDRYLGSVQKIETVLY